MARQKRIYPVKVNVRLLSPSAVTAEAIEQAAQILNRAQRVFCFETSRGPYLHLDEDETFHRWGRIMATLDTSADRREADFVFGILDEPIENNWFSHAVWGRAAGFISTNSWEFISTLPVASFVAYELVENLVELLWIADEAEGQRFLAEVVHHGEGRGCLNDMCEFKPRIGLKIRTGDICPDCLALLEGRLEKKELKAVQRMLDAVRRFALGREPKSGRLQLDSNVPRVSCDSVAKYAPRDISEAIFATPPAEAVSEASPDPERISTPAPMPPTVHFMMRRVPDVARCVSPRPRPTICSPAEVDQNFPFPVAHCFRAMRVEISGTRKFKTLLQLYAVITKYVTLVLLASRQNPTGGHDQETKELLSKLKFGGLGQWGKACFRLLRERLDDPAPGFLDHLAENITEAELRVCEHISKDFVKLRNETEGHGFVQSEDTYEQHFLRQLEPAQRMLKLMRPLADYTLCRLVHVKSHRAGKCIYDARILKGSNPLFEVERLESAAVPESDCLLRHPFRDEAVNLWPWLMLEDCPQCMRQMVFLYDHLESANAIFREYPNNHCKRNGELVQEINQRIG